jgi:hypothetical protein
MRTNLDIDDDVLSAVKALAKAANCCRLGVRTPCKTVLRCLHLGDFSKGAYWKNQPIRKGR